MIPGAETAGAEVWKRWLLRGRIPEVEARSGAFVLRHGWRFRLSASLMFGLFLTACLGVCLPADTFAGEPLWKVIGLQAFSVVTVLMSGYLLGTAWLDRAEASEAGIKSRRFLKGEVSIAWPEITALSISKNREWMVITVLSGSTHKLSMLFHGLRSLWNLVERHVDQVRCELLLAYSIPLPTVDTKGSSCRSSTESR